MEFVCNLVLGIWNLLYNSIMWKEELAIKVKSSWRIFAALAIVFVFSAYLGIREFWRWLEIEGEYSGIKKEIVLTESKSVELKHKFENIKNPELLEKEARSRLNLKKEGEYVLVVVGEDNFPKENFLNAEATSVFDNPDSIWFNFKKWKDYLFP